MILLSRFPVVKITSLCPTTYFLLTWLSHQTLRCGCSCYQVDMKEVQVPYSLLLLGRGGVPLVDSAVTSARELLTRYRPAWKKAQISCSSLTLPATALGRQDSAPNLTPASNVHWLNTGCGTSLELMVVLSVLVACQTSLCAPLLNLQVWAALACAWWPSRSLAFSAPNLDWNRRACPMAGPETLPVCLSPPSMLS